jgi:Fe2+ transport system protein FeoA
MVRRLAALGIERGTRLAVVRRARAGQVIIETDAGRLALGRAYAEGIFGGESVRGKTKNC